MNSGVYTTSFPVKLTLLVALVACCQQAQADPGAECRQEAEMYGIPPEQFEEYVDGCVLSRGGYVAQEPDATEAMPDSATDTMEATPEYVEQSVVESVEEENNGAQ